MELDSLYSEYIKEREQAEILIKPYGFITYKIRDEECFIVDMFISKKNRGENKSKNLIGELAKIAIEKGCKFISGHIQDNDGGSTQTMAAAISNGFRIFRSDPGRIVIIKSLSGSL